MESLIFALTAVLPIILMVVIGYLIKKAGLVGADFAKAANKLVFRLFLPAMLFLNVYNIESLSELRFGYIGYAAAVVIIVFLVAIPLVLWITKPNERRGPLLQACFRSNFALIGLPLGESLFGAAGLASAGILSAVSIPLYNILAVISLSLFRRGGERPSVRKILLGIVKNPLIQSIFAAICVLGIRMILVQNGIAFRLSDLTPLFKVLTYLSNLATPLALLVLGIQFDFGTVKTLKKEIFFGTLMRSLFVPLCAIGFAFLGFRDHFNGAEFAAVTALFATPVAVSSVPMAQEMDADAILAGQLVVWTTPISAITIFAASFLLKAAGIF